MTLMIQPPWFLVMATSWKSRMEGIFGTGGWTVHAFSPYVYQMSMEEGKDLTGALGNRRRRPPFPKPHASAAIGRRSCTPGGGGKSIS